MGQELGLLDQGFRLTQERTDQLSLVNQILTEGQNDVRQEVLVLYLTTSSLRGEVISWSTFDGASADEPDTGDEFEPPYRTGLDALRDGWRLFAASPLLPAYPGTEYLTSHQKFEFFFERLVPASAGKSPAGVQALSRTSQGSSSNNGHDTASTRPAGGDNRLSTEQMAEFVARGVLIFEGLVPDEINAVASAELADEHSRLRYRYPRGSALDACFGDYAGVSAAMGLPAVQGVISSLVGPTRFMTTMPSTAGYPATPPSNCMPTPSSTCGRRSTSSSCTTPRRSGLTPGAPCWCRGAISGASTKGT